MNGYVYMLVCPHCKSQRILAVRPPKDVVVVMPCPSCQGLVVLFRNKVIALNRQTLEQGSREQIVTHIADVIGEFLDAGVFPGFGEHTTNELEPESPARDEDMDSEVSSPPISQEEMDRFVKIELKCIDNPAYFKRHFG